MNGCKVYPKTLDALTGSPHYAAFQKSFRLTWERRHLACKKFCKTQCRLEACAPRGRMLKAQRQSVITFEYCYVCILYVRRALVHAVTLYKARGIRVSTFWS